MILFYGGKQAGCMAMLALKAAFPEEIFSVIPQDDDVRLLAETLGIISAYKEPDEAIEALKPEVFVCCHGRKLIYKWETPKHALNIHPCLWKYKGAKPVKRFLKSGDKFASVGMHRMTNVLDEGEVILEPFVSVEGCKTEIEVYNRLYPLYAKVAVEGVKKVLS